MKTQTKPTPINPAAQAAAPAPPSTTPRLAADQPSEYALLTRAIDRASEEERAFLYELLTDFAEAPLDLPVAALRMASHALKLGIHAESAAEWAEDYRGLTQIAIDDNWLYGFLHILFILRFKPNFKMTPDRVMELLADEMTEFDVELRVARKAMQVYPEHLADDIRKAADALARMGG